MATLPCVQRVGANRELSTAIGAVHQSYDCVGIDRLRLWVILLVVLLISILASLVIRSAAYVQVPRGSWVCEGLNGDASPA